MPKEKMRRKAADNPYLHKDFHGALSCGMEYLHARFGAEAVAPIEQRLDRPPGCKVFVPQSVILS